MGNNEVVEGLAPKAGADMEVANEIGGPKNTLMNDSIGLAPQKLRGAEEGELTPS